MKYENLLVFVCLLLIYDVRGEDAKKDDPVHPEYRLIAKIARRTRQPTVAAEREKYWNDYAALKAVDREQSDLKLYNSLTADEKDDLRMLIRAGPDADLLTDIEKKYESDQRLAAEAAQHPEPKAKVEFRLIAKHLRLMQQYAMPPDEAAAVQATYDALSKEQQSIQDWKEYKSLSESDLNELRSRVRRSTDAKYLDADRLLLRDPPERLGKNEEIMAEEYRLVARHYRLKQANQDPAAAKAQQEKYAKLPTKQQEMEDMHLYNSLSISEKTALRKIIGESNDGKKFGAAATVVDNMDQHHQQRVRIGAAILRQQQEKDLMDKSPEERKKILQEKNSKRKGVTHDDFMKAQHQHWHEAEQAYMKLSAEEKLAWARRFGFSKQGSVHVDENKALADEL